VGNPFAATAYIMGDGAFYTMNEAGTELEANTTLTSIAPMEGVFVLAEEDGETLTFTTEEPCKNGAMMAINLSRPSTGSGSGSTTAVIDRAIVRFGEGRMLPKFQMNPNHTKVYIPMDGEDYAVASVSAGRDAMHCVSTEIPVNFKAEKNGTYMLSFNCQEVSFSYLHLIDNMTGNDIDLLDVARNVSTAPTYTFNANTTDYASRFKLVFVCGDANGDNGNFAFINNGNIIITEDMDDATLQVVDVMGHIIVSHDGRTRCVPTGGMTPGVYVLRLIRGNDVRTQKIVIE
jgi:hypothetical protein